MGKSGIWMTDWVQLMQLVSGIGSLLQRMGLVLRCIWVEDLTMRRHLISIVLLLVSLGEEWRRMKTIVETLERRNLLLGRLSLDGGK